MATTVSILIATVEARTRVRVGSLTIRDLLNDAPNTCAFTIDGSAPSVGQSLRVTVNSVLLFNGTLQTVELSYEGKPANLAWRCTALDDTARANRRRPFGTWSSVSATTVAQSLITNFASGFTSTNVAAALPAISVNFDGSEGMSGCLRQIAKLIGGYFYFEDLDLHLFQTEASATPDPIDTSHPFCDDPPITVSMDLSQLRTRVYGKGYGTTVTVDAAVGTTWIKVDEPGRFSASGGMLIAGTQRITYTKKSLIDPSFEPWKTGLPAPDGGGWHGLAWSETLGLFVATNNSTGGVMTSGDGITWTSRTPAAANPWNDVVWAPSLNLFVAVAYSGANQIMTSPDGITWTGRTASIAKSWGAIAWSPSLSLFVAVAFSSVNTTAVMTSPDGITWTSRTASVIADWKSVVWAPSLSLFVAISNSANVMTSPDGITWTTRTGIAPGSTWEDLAWSPTISLFVAVGINKVMTSPDGITWTSRTYPSGGPFAAVTWADELGLFVAVGLGSAVMTSPDGITWTMGVAPVGGIWSVVAWGAGAGRLVVGGGTTGTIFLMTNGYNAVAGIATSGAGSILTAIKQGDPVNIFVQRDDLTAQAAMAAIDGGDGIYEYLVVDERRALASLTALCDAELDLFAYPIVTVTGATRDLKMKSGKPLTITLATPPISQTLVVQDVTISEIDVAANTNPKFTFTASTLRFSLEDLLRRMSALLAA